MAEPIEEPINDLEFDLDCPTCGTVLTDDSTYETYRVCPSCRRHFWISGRDRLALLIDPGEFSETNSTLASVDPLLFRDPLPISDRLAGAHEREFLTDAVITGIAEIGGHPNVLVILDFAYWGGTVGVVAGEKITLAMELAASRRIPLIVFCSGGSAHAKEGILSVVQMAKTSNAAGRLHRAGVPFISVLTHPTTGAVLAGLANQADIVIAEPGTRASVTSEGGGASSLASAEQLLTHGMIDGVVDRTEMRAWIGSLLSMLAGRGVARPTDSHVEQQHGTLLAFEETAISRHHDRPTAAAYLHALTPEFIELHGDRVSGDDPATICGIGNLDGVTFAVIAQNRTGQSLMGASGYRKAARLMRLASHLELPLLTLIDAPSLPSSVEAELTGLGTGLGQALGLLAMLPIPVVSVVIGEANSLAALALGIGDRLLMQEHAVFAVGSGAGAHVTARECLRLGIIDAIVPEPEFGAHSDPQVAAGELGAAIIRATSELSGAAPRRLLDERSRRIRLLGQATPESREATKIELTELQEIQRSISRSLGDLRERWETRQMILPNLSQRAHLPAFPKVSVRRADLEALAGRLAAGGRGLVRSATSQSKQDEESAP